MAWRRKPRRQLAAAWSAGRTRQALRRASGHGEADVDQGDRDSPRTGAAKASSRERNPYTPQVQRGAEPQAPNLDDGNRGCGNGVW